MTFAIALIEQALAHPSYSAKEYVPTDIYRPTSLRAPYESCHARASSRALRPAFGITTAPPKPPFGRAPLNRSILESACG